MNRSVSIFYKLATLVECIVCLIITKNKQKNKQTTKQPIRYIHYSFQHCIYKMRSGKVSQTTTNIYGGKRNEETPLLYNEGSFEPFNRRVPLRKVSRSHSTWETITIVPAEAKVDEGATQPKVPVQMDKAFLSATVLQLYSSKPLLLVVATLALMFVMYNIVVHDAIVPFAAAILLSGIRLIVIEWNRRQQMLDVWTHSAQRIPFCVTLGGRSGRVDVDKFPGYGVKLSPDTT